MKSLFYPTSVTEGLFWTWDCDLDLSYFGSSKSYEMLEFIESGKLGIGR